MAPDAGARHLWRFVLPFAALCALAFGLALASAFAFGLASALASGFASVFASVFACASASATFSFDFAIALGSSDGVSRISMRRLRARPVALLLLAIGWYSP